MSKGTVSIKLLIGATTLKEKYFPWKLSENQCVVFQLNRNNSYWSCQLSLAASQKCISGKSATVWQLTPTVFLFSYVAIKCRVFFYNSHRVKSSLLSLELSFRSLLQGIQTSKWRFYTVWQFKTSVSIF